MTEQRPEFEDVPVVRLARPADAQRVQAAAVIVVAILAILIVKPWGEPRRPVTAAASSASLVPNASPQTVRPAATPRADGARVYEPGLFGRYSVTPRWELWPTAYVYRFALSGPLALDPSARPAPIGSADPVPSPTPTPIPPPPSATELVDIGATDLLMVIGLNTPTGTRVLDARLWRFPTDGPPVRMPLRDLPPPWPVDFFHVYGLRVADDSDPDLVAVWPAGVYRLDLLVDPGARIRRIGLLVRPPAGTPPGETGPTDTGPPTPPPAAEPGPLTGPLDLATGQVALGDPGRQSPAGPWIVRDLPDDQDCGLTELWLAEGDRPGGPCSAIVASDVSVAAVDLGPGSPVRALRFDQVDPVGSALVMVDRTADARATNPRFEGRIVATAVGQKLAEGTYRLVATLADGSERGWYVRILPAGGGGG
jgi:hypothetical protein